MLCGQTDQSQSIAAPYANIENSKSHLVWPELAGHVRQPADVAGGGTLSRDARHLAIRKTAFKALLDTLPLYNLPICPRFVCVVGGNPIALMGCCG